MTQPVELQTTLRVPEQDFHTLLRVREAEIMTAIRHHIARVDIPRMVEQHVVTHMNAMVDRAVREAIDREVSCALSAFIPDITDRVQTALKEKLK